MSATSKVIFLADHGTKTPATHSYYGNLSSWGVFILLVAVVLSVITYALLVNRRGKASKMLGWFVILIIWVYLGSQGNGALREILDDTYHLIRGKAGNS